MIVCEYGHENYEVGELFCSTCGATLNTSAQRSVQLLNSSLGVGQTSPVSVPTVYLDVLDGTGWAPPVGAKVAVTIEDTKIVFQDSVGLKYVCLLKEVRDISVVAKDSVSGPRFFGGGFGVKGAVEGMATSVILNKLTRKSRRFIVVKILSDTGRSTLVAPDANDASIKTFFRNAQDRSLQLAGQSRESKPTDSISVLERLADLHTKGVLSDEEFSVIKSRILSE